MEAKEAIDQVAEASVAGIAAKAIRLATSPTVVSGIAAYFPIKWFIGWFKAKYSATEIRVEVDKDIFFELIPVHYSVRTQWPVGWGLPPGVRRDRVANKPSRSGDMYVYSFATKELPQIKRRLPMLRSIIKLISDKGGSKVATPKQSEESIEEKKSPEMQHAIAAIHHLEKAVSLVGTALDDVSNDPVAGTVRDQLNAVARLMTRAMVALRGVR